MIFYSSYDNFLIVSPKNLFSLSLSYLSPFIFHVKLSFIYFSSIFFHHHFGHRSLLHTSAIIHHTFLQVLMTLVCWCTVIHHHLPSRFQRVRWDIVCAVSCLHRDGTTCFKGPPRRLSNAHFIVCKYSIQRFNIGLQPLFSL